MKRGFMAAVALSLFVGLLAQAGEHPEHPTSSHSRKNTGKKAKMRQKKEKAPQWVEHKKTMEAFVAAVKGHVKMKVADEGSFKVYDDKLDKTWELRLVRIHHKRIARLAENKFFACADFKTVAGGKDRAELDLDFFVTSEGDVFTVDEVLVHKVEGKPRYTYDSKNQRVPVTAHREHKKKEKSPAGKPAKEHPKGAEHPAGGEHPH